MAAPVGASVMSGWVRGLPDRGIEALLAEALGPDTASPKSAASRIRARIKTDFEAFRNQDFTGIRVDYLFLDGSRFEMPDGAATEPVLVTVEPAAAESTDAQSPISSRSKESARSVGTRHRR